MPSVLRALGNMGNEVRHVPLEKIHEVEGRNHRDVGDVSELQAYMKEHGTRDLDPLMVQVREGETYIVDGHRRYRAACNLMTDGEPVYTLPVQATKETDEAKILALGYARNSSKPLEPLEESRLYERLYKFGWDIPMIAKELGKREALIRDRLHLLNAEPVVKEAIQEHAITHTDAVTIVKRSNRTGERQQDVLDQVTATKIDKRRRDARAIPVETQCARALQPIIDRYGLELCRELLRCWPVLDENDGE